MFFLYLRQQLVIPPISRLFAPIGKHLQMKTGLSNQPQAGLFAMSADVSGVYATRHFLLQTPKQKLAFLECAPGHSDAESMRFKHHKTYLSCRTCGTQPVSAGQTFN